MTPARLFVYGTLAPGQPAWPLLAPFVEAHAPASAPGALFDTRRGYPAAVFGDANGVIHGAVCELRDAPFARLDAYEGDEYARIEVTLTDGSRAWTYHWIAPLQGCVLLADGRWPAPC